MTIRIALAADIPALHDLIERAYRGDSARAGWTHEADLLGGQRTDVAALTAIIADRTQLTLVAEVDGDGLTGCVNIADKGAGLAYLGLLTVDPARQAAGLGRRLIAEGEAAAVTRFGAKIMEMTVIEQRPELIDYYIRRGYALTDEVRPFPHGDARFGLPTTADLAFVVLAKPLCV